MAGLEHRPLLAGGLPPTAHYRYYLSRGFLVRSGVARVSPSLLAGRPSPPPPPPLTWQAQPTATTMGKLLCCMPHAFTAYSHYIAFTNEGTKKK